MAASSQTHHHVNYKYDLSEPSDPPIQYINASTKNMDVTSTDFCKVAYTDENPKGSRIVLCIHGFPGNDDVQMQRCIQNNQAWHNDYTVLIS